MYHDTEKLLAKKGTELKGILSLCNYKKDGTMKFSTFLADVTSILVKKNILDMIVQEPGETKFVEGKVLKLKTSIKVNTN